MMTFRFGDSFDAWDSTHENIKWTSFGGTVTVGTPGRFNVGQYADIQVSMTKTFPGGPFTYAFAERPVRYSVIAGSPTILEFGNVNQHCRLVRDSNGFLVLRGAAGTDLLTYTGAPLQTNIWYAVGFAAKWDGTTGQLRMWLNGNLVGSIDNVDTDNDASASDKFAYVLLGGGHADDFYCTGDDSITGSLSDEFRGDLIGRAHFPQNDGESAQFTPLSGPDGYAMVDEIGPDDETSYLHDSTPGNRSCFGVGPLAADLASITFTQLNHVSRFETTGPHSIRNYVRQVGVANHDSAAQALTINYVNYCDVLPTDPVTGLAWTKSGWEARQYGIKDES